jgi:aryl-alcohol dehydrogenase-like predicted oxidoreductase
MSLDHYVTLGRSGLRVSPLCLGAMTFGEDLGWGSSVEESNAIIDDYLERGGNFIDTANIYTHGHSEKIIGDLAVRAAEGRRALLSSRRAASGQSGGVRARRACAPPQKRRIVDRDHGFHDVFRLAITE